MMIFRFVGAFLVAAASMIGVSLLWPKFSNQERPVVLGNVYNAVTETDSGKQVDTLLNQAAQTVTDKDAMASASSTILGGIGNTVQTKTQEVVTHKIVEEVIRRYEVLPVDEKEFMKQAICAPAQ